MDEGPWRLTIERTGQVLAGKARVARTWRQRMVGLLAHRQLAAEEALIFPSCTSIHTFGMRFPIDVIVVDREWRVVALRECLAPGRVVWPVWRAWGVVEAPCGTLNRAGLRMGDQIVVIDVTQ